MTRHEYAAGTSRASEGSNLTTSLRFPDRFTWAAIVSFETTLPLFLTRLTETE